MYMVQCLWGVEAGFLNHLGDFSNDICQSNAFLRFWLTISSLLPPTYTLPWGHNPLSLFHPMGPQRDSHGWEGKNLRAKDSPSNLKKKALRKNISQCLHFSPLAISWRKRHEAQLVSSSAFEDPCALLSHLSAQENVQVASQI